MTRNDNIMLHDRESGRILLLVMVTIFALSAFWFIALSTTGLELRTVGGRKSASQQFFDAEAGLTAAMENFSGLAGSLGLDVTTTFVTEEVKDPTSAADPADQRVVAEITLRPIQRQSLTKSQEHNQPYQRHESAPPAGSGSGVNSTVIKRYSIDSKSGNKELQAGVYRVVPK